MVKNGEKTKWADFLLWVNILLRVYKAFDVVPHQRLLHKLDHYGIRGTTLNWIQNFLTNRTQKVE